MIHAFLLINASCLACMNSYVRICLVVHFWYSPLILLTKILQIHSFLTPVAVSIQMFPNSVKQCTLNVSYHWMIIFLVWQFECLLQALFWGTNDQEHCWHHLEKSDSYVSMWDYPVHNYNNLWKSLFSNTVMCTSQHSNYICECIIYIWISCHQIQN